jgi:hypothetical protein
VKNSSFDDVLQVLGWLDGWLQRLGIPIRDDRWHQAVGTVQRVRERSEIIARGGSVVPPPSDNYVDGLFEALEIFEILTAFEGETSDALRTKVARAVSGPISPLAEQPKNSEARNTMFELSLAAGWKNKGLDVELGEPDIRVTVQSRAFRVECKRPFKWRTKLEAVEPGEEAARPSTHASAQRKENLHLKRLLAEKAMEVDFLKGALQKVEARRQRSSGSGAKTSTNTSKN